MYKYLENSTMIDEIPIIKIVELFEETNPNEAKSKEFENHISRLVSLIRAYNRINKERFIDDSTRAKS